MDLNFTQKTWTCGTMGLGSGILVMFLIILHSLFGKACKEGFKYRQLTATVQLQEDKQDHWVLKMSFTGLSICRPD